MQFLKHWKIVALLHFCHYKTDSYGENTIKSDTKIVSSGEKSSIKIKDKVGNVFISQTRADLCSKYHINGYNEGDYISILPSRNSIVLVETQINPNQLYHIGEILSPSREYEISFQMTVKGISPHYVTIIRFTADLNSMGRKYGDRSPIFQIQGGKDKMHLSQSTTENSNPWWNSPTSLGTNIEHHIKFIAEGDEVSLYIDGILDSKVHNKLSTRPQLEKLDVYYGDPFHPIPDVILNNLIFTPLNPKLSWDWITCAKECASSNECEFWILSSSDNTCKLMKNKGAFHEDIDYQTGESDQGCHNICSLGFVVELRIIIPENPQFISWQVRKENEIHHELSQPYPESSETKNWNHEICIEKGVYEFNIQNSDGSGLVGYEPPIGSQKIIFKNEIVAEGNPYFGYRDSFRFGICESDIDCEVNDSCFLGNCNNITNICHFQKLKYADCLSDYDGCDRNVSSCIPSSCGECGLHMIDIEVRTDWNPDNILWEVTDQHGMSVFNSSGIFQNWRYELQSYSTCLGDGIYLFNIYNRMGLGLSDGIKGWYKINVNDRIIHEGGASDNFLNEKKKFSLCSSDISCNDDNVCTDDYCDIVLGTCYYEQSRIYHMNCGIFGNALALAIRVEAQDSQTTSSEQEISDNFYGTYGKSLTMSSQFAACSYHQFNTVPFNSSSHSGKNISNGVISIILEDSVRSKSADTVANMVLNVVSLEYGDIESQFDFVMLCLPSGVVIGTTEYWKAYAFVGSYLSIYNNDFCNSPSVQMHELGHNFGLSHSNDEENYGDESGYMGISYSNLYGPKKCFNGPKTWQLGWLSSGHIEVDSRTLIKHENYAFSLIGTSSYEERTDQSTIIKLINSNDGYDYYISFNTNTSMNTETGEGINQVLITKRLTGTMFEDSNLIGKLDILDSFALFGFDNGNDILILLQSIENGNIAHLTITKLNIFCSLDTDCDDLNPCSIDTCSETIERGNKVCDHFPVECTACGSAVDVQIYTSNAPEQIAWDIKDINSDRIIQSSGYYTEHNSFYTDNDCLAYGTYVFSISYGESKELALDDFDFAFYVGSTLMDRGNVSEAAYIESFFIICTADIECKDYDGCSIDICNTTSRLCENILQENNDNCTDCSWMRLNITTDNYPVETTWEVLATNEKSIVISGQPYAFDLSIAFGRRKAPTRAGRSKAPTKNGRSKAPTRTSRLLVQSSHYRHLNENEVISEEICLENNYIYYFKISDSFGDGICCAEGRGSYFLTLKDHILISGGEFSYSESLVFKPMLCVENAECNDNDITTEDICFAETHVCIYRILDCSAYGVTTTVKMFSSPQLASWMIKSSSSQIILSDGPYSNLNGHFEKVECLPFGTYKITFFDALNNVTRYCGEGEDCGYILKANDVIIPQQNKIFAKDEVIYFGLCRNDADCFDGDKCTVDKCDEENKICSFSPLPCLECSDDPCNPAQSCLPSPCAQCGKCNVMVEISTDINPQDTKWKIINNETQSIHLLGETYTNVYTDYKHNDCIFEGAYKLLFFDFAGNGFSSCWEGDKCGYKLYLDQKLIKKERHFVFETETSFSCVVPSLSPPASPCTKIPSNLLTNDTWTITLDQTLGYFSATDDLTLNYCISEGKNVSQFRAYVYDESCSAKSSSKAITVFGTTIEKRENTKLDLGKVFIKFNETLVRESPFCVNCTANDALVSFCVKTELLLFVDEDTALSVSFAEAKVKSHINFLSGFSNFKINGTNLMKNYVADAHSESEMKVNACICDGTRTCIGSPLLKQNELFSVCVHSLKSEMQISRFESMILYQDGIAKFILAENGKATNELSKLSFESNMASFTTRLISAFFENPEPSDIIVFGEVILMFKQERRLNADIHDKQLKMNHLLKEHFELELRISKFYYFNSRNLFLIISILSTISTAFLFLRKKRKVVQPDILYAALQTKES